jgi:hypothetical protein
MLLWVQTRALFRIASPVRLVGNSEVEKPLFRILCANCVPDSEDTQFGKTANLTCGRLVVVAQHTFRRPSVAAHGVRAVRGMLMLSPHGSISIVLEVRCSPCSQICLGAVRTLPVREIVGHNWVTVAPEVREKGVAAGA